VLLLLGDLRECSFSSRQLIKTTSNRDRKAALASAVSWRHQNCALRFVQFQEWI
jgi:hypothetical protein